MGMVSMKKGLLVTLVAALVLVGIGYFNRVTLVLALAKFRADAVPVGPPREIPWSTGPDVPERPIGERPPNIILIVADDLGYNDISTFGGGVANGKLKTPNIDQLAAEGAIFTQSYSGAGTCAPSAVSVVRPEYRGCARPLGDRGKHDCRDAAAMVARRAV